jgi:hypothetical protein
LHHAATKKLGRSASTLRAAVLVSLLTSLGCAGHSAKTLEARNALDAGQPEKALKLYNEELKVESEKDLPKDTSGDAALLLLDRAVILQQLGLHELSARDLQVADKQVEMLDFSRSTADEIGKYLFSDDTGPYKSPPYEKLMINTINMVNYLVRGDLNGARIEARRFAVMQKYLKETGSTAASLLGAGSYLAGFTFELSGEPQEAMRYYDEALQYGAFHTLDEAIVRLSSRASYRTPRITEVLKRHPTQPSGPAAVTHPGSPTAQPSAAPASERTGDAADATTTAKPGTAAETEGEVLIVISYGRVPAKIAERVPIGLALTYASGALSPSDHAQANALAAQGLVSWVNYPTLGKARGTYGAAKCSVDKELQPLDGVPVDQHAIQAWEAEKGAVIASAITRMIARIIAGKAVETAVESSGGDGLLGLVLGLATQATLTAADTPDTRSWATLPARMAFGRVRVPAGTHTVELTASGVVLRRTLVVKPRGFSAISLTVLR